MHEKNINMGLENQGSKPKGRTGIIFGKLMNAFHTGIYIKYFNNNLPVDNSVILDIGCGGGKFLKYLSAKNSTYRLFGLDHSEEMVSLSQKINQETIKQNRMEIFLGSVINIPVNNDLIDMVTAFETVQFWPDIERSFTEIARVLKKGGVFTIINWYPREGSKWWKIAKLKSEKEYIMQFENSGFEKVVTDLNYKKGWIIIKGIKK